MARWWIRRCSSRRHLPVSKRSNSQTLRPESRSGNRAICRSQEIHMRTMFGVFAVILLCAATDVSAHDANRGHDLYEVWAVDQSNSPGKTYGGTLYVYNGMKLVRHPGSAVPELIDLAGAASEMCFAK